MKELEERGIGRPSTYAAVIETIQARGYVWRKGTALVPAWTAFAVTNLLEQHFGHLVDYGFTATMEEALDVIARGEGEAEKWLHSFYFGNGTPGLRELVSDEQLATGRPPRRQHDPDRRRRHRPRARRARRPLRPVRAARRDRDRVAAARDRARRAHVELALELIAKQAAGPTSLGTDPETGLPVYVLTGRFGPYVQLGEQEEGTKKKPKRASLFASQTPETVTLDEALQLLSLPRSLGVDAEGREILASPGRFGPYLKRADGETRSLAAEEQLLHGHARRKPRRCTRSRSSGAAASRSRRSPSSASTPTRGAPVRVLDGRYGPYVTDGTTNATVPRGTDPAELTLAEAVALLRAPRARWRRRRPKKAAKKTAKKTDQEAGEEGREEGDEEGREEDGRRSAAAKTAVTRTVGVSDGVRA